MNAMDVIQYTDRLEKGNGLVYRKMYFLAIYGAVQNEIRPVIIWMIFRVKE